MNDELQPGQRLMLYVLRDVADEDGRVRVGTDRLTELCGWRNRNSARKRLHELENMGLLTIVPQRDQWGGALPNLIILKGV